MQDEAIYKFPKIVLDIVVRQDATMNKTDTIHDKSGGGEAKIHENSRDFSTSEIVLEGGVKSEKIKNKNSGTNYRYYSKKMGDDYVIKADDLF